MQTRWFGIAAVVIAAYGAGLYYEQNFAPADCCGLTWPTPDPVQAERIVSRSDPQGINPAAQKQAAVAVIGARPGDPTGWLRLAHADWLAHSALLFQSSRTTEAGRRALDTSYLITPYGGGFTPWRVRLALDTWSTLSASERQDVVNEIQVAKQDTTLGATRAAVVTIFDPAGRQAAAALGIGPAPRPTAP